MRTVKLFLPSIILIFMCFSMSAKSDSRCAELLKKQISIDDFNENVEEFLLNFKILIDCEFEEIDYEIFMGPLGNLPMMARPLFEMTEDVESESKYTFQDLKELLVSIKNEPEYLRIKNIIEARNLIFDKQAYISNWENDARLIEQLDASEALLEEIFNLVKVNEGKKYWEIFLMYSNNLASELEKEQKEVEKENAEYIAENPGTRVLVKGLYAYENYEVGLNKSKESKKPLLLYFNGYACVNARKMDEFILSEPEVQDYIKKNFVIVNLLVDDKHSLKVNEQFYSKILNREIKTVGQKNSEFQIREFKANAQPLFIIVSADGREVSRIGYVTEVSKFNDFLKRR